MTDTTGTPTGSQTGDTQLKPFTRLSVNINDDTADALQRLKSEKGISITEAVRRAVALLDLVERETNKPGQPGKLQIVDYDGAVRQLLLFT
ncbi:ribbon-helix-helix protein, CopG family [Kitasatospora purpeofusca]|uniref:ribbon-helix-helix protein, CopG family n=1 Tax=Kitasatospora purpeofusca TaxID=67352 RepID=UPI002250F412|nr:ribbon-helix-helix protein, CopG family [Kitasatospora purpeofusca]MCX4757851.1 ribbon-helix-helix protein, CopG family [Kitasatospora purpeofusca]WSR34456.1 ribbon-helix-helix protein, CopG family [Kitasatospora purpeofusca]